MMLIVAFYMELYKSVFAAGGGGSRVAGQTAKSEVSLSDKGDGRM